MSEIIPFPVPNKPQPPDLEAQIEKMLATIPGPDREKLKFELIKTLDRYDAYFTEWELSLPEQADELLKQQIYDIAHREHDRKMRMLGDIIRLKVRALVADYHRR